MPVIDRLAVHDFAIALRQMLQQAGSHLAEVARLEVGGDLAGKRVVVVVGTGNQGAGGLVAARHLANRGASVRVLLARPVARLMAPGREQVATLPGDVDQLLRPGVRHDRRRVEAALAGADLVVERSSREEIAALLD